MPTIATWSGLDGNELEGVGVGVGGKSRERCGGDESANRSSGVSMLKAVLSKRGVCAGSGSSAHRGPSRDVDCVVA